MINVEAWMYKLTDLHGSIPQIRVTDKGIGVDTYAKHIRDDPFNCLGILSVKEDILGQIAILGNAVPDLQDA